MNLYPRIYRLVLLIGCLLKAIFLGRADKKLPTISKIIVVPTGKLGDVVCNTPILLAIRNFLPDTRIIVAGVTKLHQPLLVNSGLVDEYLDLEEKGAIKRIKKVRAQAALITGPSYESTALMYLAGIPLVVAPVVQCGVSPNETRPYKIIQRLVKTFPYRMGEYAPRERLKVLEPLGVFSEDTKKQLGFSPKAEEKVRQFFIDREINPDHDLVIGVSPSAGNKIKEWPTVRFAKIVEHLVNKYQAKVIVIGSRSEQDKVKEVIDLLEGKIVVIDASGLFNIDELKALMSKLKMFISVDTGPIYIAEAFGIPTIDITGPIDEKEQPPQGPFHRNVIPPQRIRPELSVLNARRYNQEEALRQVESITISAVATEIDKLIADLKNNQYETGF